MTWVAKLTPSNAIWGVVQGSRVTPLQGLSCGVSRALKMCMMSCVQELDSNQSKSNHGRGMQTVMYLMYDWRLTQP